MLLIRSFLYFLISFLSSIVGVICGIGGGVIIKPTLDLFSWDSVAAISFLSGCTVLAMSCFSVIRSFASHEKTVNVKTVTFLAIGASVGGVFGNRLFNNLKELFDNPNSVGTVQAICLAAVTVGTLVYTLLKEKIVPHKINNSILYSVIGLLLGVMSSFLGIGGGPINIVVLHFFFAMDSKTAATNSLYIIMFSQISNLIVALLTHSVPEFKLLTLAFMVCGGVVGSMVGRKINKKLNNKAVDKLFISLMAVIIFINIYNIFKYLSVS